MEIPRKTSHSDLARVIVMEIMTASSDSYVNNAQAMRVFLVVLAHLKMVRTIADILN
jgi:hypothetical protein